MLNYTVQVPNTVHELTLTPTAAGVNAAIMVNGNAVASGSPANAVSLNVGSTAITVLVTAEDPTTKKTYTVEVTRLGAPYTGIAPQYLHYTLPDQYNYLANNPGKTVADEAEILFSGYTLTNGVIYQDGSLISGYALGQFVDKSAVNEATPDLEGVLGTNDARALYSVLVRSNMDGFSIRTHFLTLGIYTVDLRWDQFIQGYLLDLNYSGRVFYPASVGVVKKHNNKYAYDIYMFRKIDVKRPDAAGSLATFEVQATTDSYVDDTYYHSITSLSTTKFTVGTMSFGAYTNARVIPLKQFLTDYVTATPGNYTYKIVALDGTYKEGWTYADMQQAYYLPDNDLIVQVDASNNELSGTKINFPVRIELISGSTVEYDYSAKNPPAYAKAY